LNTFILRILASMQNRERGQTLAEYGLIMAVIAVAIVLVAGIAFRTAVINSFQAATKCLQDAGGPVVAGGC